MASTNKTTNYSLSQFLADDVPSWISDYTADMQKIEEGMTDNKAGVKSVQPDEYSDASTYSVGDYCIENNTIYKCKTAINSPEEFNPSHWEETTIYKELSAVNSRLKRGRIDIVSGIQLDYNGYLATLYLGITAQSYSEGWNIIGKIPESYRPSRELDFVVADNLANSATDATPILSRIDSDGNIKVYAYSDKTRFAPDGSVTYILD